MHSHLSVENRLPETQQKTERNDLVVLKTADHQESKPPHGSNQDLINCFEDP